MDASLTWPTALRTIGEEQTQAAPRLKNLPGCFYRCREVGDRGQHDDARCARRPKADFATQSGPMLVIDGSIHPAFIVNSTDLKPRDGVGVSSPTEVHFVISKGLGELLGVCSFFRDGLGCSNTLVLDGGGAPGLYAPELGRNDPPAHSTGPSSRW